jgi:hypothetical protein
MLRVVALWTVLSTRDPGIVTAAARSAAVDLAMNLQVFMAFFQPLGCRVCKKFAS